MIHLPTELLKIIAVFYFYKIVYSIILRKVTPALTEGCPYSLGYHFLTRKTLMRIIKKYYLSAHMPAVHNLMHNDLGILYYTCFFQS